MSREVSHGTKILPGTETPNKLDFKVWTTEVLAAYDIVYVTGIQGQFYQVAKADAATAAQSRGMLLMVRHASQANKWCKAAAIGTIKDVDTSGDLLGAPYYLGTAGQVTNANSGFTRRIGTVIKVGTVGLHGGRILFDGLNVPSANVVISGTVAFASGQATVTVLAATLGGLYGGRPVVATFNSTDTTNTILSAVWSTNDLVITRTAGSATTPTVAYMISVG